MSRGIPCWRWRGCAWASTEPASRPWSPGQDARCIAAGASTGGCIDDLYFRASGGGVTFGGGEPLLHAEYLLQFRSLAPDGWKIRLETSLAVQAEQVIAAAEAADEFIVDCKDMNPEIYRRYTGGDRDLMVSNLRRLLDLAGAERILVRVPLIPDYNTEKDQERSVAALKSLGITRFDLFPYSRRDL